MRGFGPSFRASPGFRRLKQARPAPLRPDSKDKRQKYPRTCADELNLWRDLSEPVAKQNNSTGKDRASTGKNRPKFNSSAIIT
jgi:hypothetical protein